VNEGNALRLNMPKLDTMREMQLIAMAISAKRLVSIACFPRWAFSFVLTNAEYGSHELFLHDKLGGPRSGEILADCGMRLRLCPPCGAHHERTPG
jgi:hypothetical protein